jgi:hypothetical protein
MKLIDLLLPIVGNVLTVWLAAILLWRKLHTKYPFFFALVLFSIVVTSALLFVPSGTIAYFTTYWAVQALYTVLSLFSLHEVFRHVFRFFYDLFFWLRLLFPAVGLIIALISVYQAILHPPAQASALVGVILSFSMIANYVRLGLFILFFVLVLLLGSSWRNYPFGIMQGFAAASLGELLSFGLRYDLGTKFSTLATYGPPVASICGVVLWLSTFLRSPDPEAVSFWQVTPEQLFGSTKTYRLTRILRKAHSVQVR